MRTSKTLVAIRALLVQCLAEFIGTFIYVFPGEGATAALILTTRTSSSTNSNLGSLLNVGVAYSSGIILAILLTAHISGAHLSPGVTLTFTLFRKFPAYKIVPYIISQLLGAIVATLSVYGIYGQQLKALENGLVNAGLPQLVISPSGPAGIGGIFPSAGQDLGRVFLGEFLVGCLLGLVICGALDSKKNALMNHQMIPFLIATAYLIAIIAFAPNTIVLNTARGLGGHFATSMLYGQGVFDNKSFIALATLTNIPATVVGSLLYNLMRSCEKERKELEMDVLTNSKENEVEGG